MPQKKSIPEKKENFHPRNRHRHRYNFPELIKACPELADYVSPNPFEDLSIDFTNPKAIKALNKA